MGRESEINIFMEKGLSLYGIGKFNEAIREWEKVFEIDPNNQIAKDYIESAGGNVQEKIKSKVKETLETPKILDSTIEENYLDKFKKAKELFRFRDFEKASQVFDSVITHNPLSIEAYAYKEMIRVQEFRKYLSKVGDLNKTPKISKSSNEIINYNLSKEAGFILSFIDGMVSYDEIVSLTGMDRLTALRCLVELINTNIVST